MDTQVIMVTEFHYEVISDFQGHLEAAMAVRCNTHMETKVIEVAHFILRPVGQLA